MNNAKNLETLAEIRNCASIIGLIVSRIIKKLSPAVETNLDLYNYLKMLDDTLTKHDYYIKELESLNLSRNGVLHG